MNKTLLKTISLAVTAVLLITAVFATSVFAALFSSSVPIGSDVLFHQVEQGLSSSFDYISTDLTFEHAGDTKEIQLTLSNTSSGPFRYYYKLALMEEEDEGLESAILVFFDGEYLGTLAQLAIYDGLKIEYTIDNDYYILGGSVSNPSEEKHTLAFQLHMAAQGSGFENKKCKVNILSYAQTHDVKKVIFAKSAQELYYALHDVSADAVNTDKKIILTSNIVLTKDLEVTRPCTIDLRGFDIDFSGYNISLLHNGVLTVKSSKTLPNNASGTGRFLLNSLLGAVNFEDSASFYAFNYFDIEEISGQLRYDKALAKELLTDRFESKLANLKLNDLQSFSPFGALYCYILKGGISLTSSSGYGFDTETGVLTPPQPLQNSVNAVISIDGQDFIFKMVGKNESALQELFEQYLQHIPNVTISGGKEVLPSVTYDLFLPLRIDALNAAISWYSDNANLMTSSGRIGETAQGQVSLTAEIRINEELYQHKFKFYVVRQNNEMRFLYLLALLNPITLSEVYPAEGSLFVLPVVDEESDYHYTAVTNGKELGLVALTYEIDPSYYYLALSDIDTDGYINEVYIKEATFQVYAQVTVTGYFSENEYYTGSVGVKIELGENTELQNAVFRHVASYLSGVDVLQNIIDTRVLYGMHFEKGDFTLPLTYNGFNIEYTIPTVANRMQGEVDRYKAQDTGYIDLMAWAQGGAKKAASLVVSTGLSAALGAVVSDGTPAITEEERAVLKGYDHDPLYTQIIIWAMGSSTSASSTVWAAAPAQQAALTADGLSTISGGEGEVILMYALSRGYSGFSSQWEKYFDISAGVNEESGDYNFNLTGGIITSITQNAEGKAVLALNALNFNTTDTSVPLDIKVYMSSIATGEETREMYFTVPSVIKKNASGFSEEDVYNAVKLQVWQQLPQNEQLGLDIDTINNQIEINDIANWDYILIRDIKLASTLVFQNGSPEEQFAALLGWSTSTSNAGQEVQYVMNFFVGHTLAQNVSDGYVYISNDEYAAIEAFLGGYEGFDDMWSQATTEAYNLTTEGRNTLLTSSSSGGINAFLATFTNLSRSTDTFSEYIDWARGTSYHKSGFLGTTTNFTTMANYGATIAGSSDTTMERTIPSITSSDAAALVAAFKNDNMLFREFEGAWNAALTLLGLSGSDFYVLSAAPTTVTALPTASISTNYVGYIYSGNLHIGTRYYDDVYWGSSTAKYRFYNAGAATDVKYTTLSALETAIVSAMKTVILSRYTTLLNWATGTGTPTTAGISYLDSTYQTYTSDSKATVSANERGVIVNFWNKVLPIQNTNFGTLWNNTVPPVDVFTDTGRSELNEFYQSKQEASSSLPLLDLAENNLTNNNTPLGATIPRGMTALLNNADKTQAGSIYKYTGTSGTYTNGQYYRLNYNSDTYQYSFAEISIPSYASPQSLLDFLHDADENEVGKTYLYTGENTENFISGLAYQIRYDEKSGEYYFKALRIEEVDSAISYRELYYPYIVGLDMPAVGMNYFTNLKELYLFGAPSDLTPIFTSTTNAKNFFNRVTSYNLKLNRLVMQYASLGDISSIGVFTQLNFLDLLGNGILSKIGALTNLNSANLSYLDLHNTGVTYGYNIAIFANIYYSYYGAHGSYPTIYYTDSGDKTPFSTTLTQTQIEILQYLFYLKEIGSSNSEYTILPGRVYVSSTQYYAVTWYEVIDGAENVLSALSSGAYRYTNIYSGTATPSSTILRAKITVGGVTYYRDFEVVLAG